MPSVHAIIVVYNGRRNDWIHKCLDSISTSTVNVKVIAIDNGSADDSVEYVRKHHPGVDLIETGRNLGFGKANNIGIEKAISDGAEFVLLLNQDAWVQRNTIEMLIRRAVDNPDYGVISPVHLNGTGTALDKNFANYIVPSECPNFLSDAVLNKLKDALYPINFVNAAAWLVSRECLRKVGGFSPLFFHYGEDDNYCQRVAYKGLKIGIDPHCFVYHDREDRVEPNIEQAERRKIASKLVYAANPNDNSLPLSNSKIIADSLGVLYNSGSLSEVARLVEFYRKRGKEIKNALEESRSDEEFLYIS